MKQAYLLDHGSVATDKVLQDATESTFDRKKEYLPKDSPHTLSDTMRY